MYRECVWVEWERNINNNNRCLTTGAITSWKICLPAERINLRVCPDSFFECILFFVFPILNALFLGNLNFQPKKFSLKSFLQSQALLEFCTLCSIFISEEFEKFTNVVFHRKREYHLLERRKSWVCNSHLIWITEKKLLPWLSFGFFFFPAEGKECWASEYEKNINVVGWKNICHRKLTLHVNKGGGCGG